MSLGLTPREFVKQVFYVQEKVLLDFYPTDDVFKEVLTEANLVLQELQKEEDWLWLRDTLPVGFAFGEIDFTEQFAHKNKRDKFIQLPDFVYRPSGLFGDCVRLCDYRWLPEFLDKFKNYENWFDYWKNQLSTGTITPEDSYVFYGEISSISHGFENYVYGGSFLNTLHDMNYDTLPHHLERNHWYVDSEGTLIITSDGIPDVIYTKRAPLLVPDVHKKYYLMHENKLPWQYHGVSDAHPIYLNPLGFNNIVDCLEVDDEHSIKVPYKSAGNLYRKDVHQTGYFMQPEPVDMSLGAVMLGQKLGFTRPLLPHEQNKIILMDFQRRIEPFHICDDLCKSRLEGMSGKAVPATYPDNPCVKVLDQTIHKMLTEIPDPNYVVYRTAALHAEGSPVAQGRLVSLQDLAKKLLSAMRQSNAMSTVPEFLDWEPVTFVDVV